MKWGVLPSRPACLAVAPRTGGRGLKYTGQATAVAKQSRPPHRGAWIEMCLFAAGMQLSASPPAQGGVD